MELIFKNCMKGGPYDVIIFEGNTVLKVIPQILC